jgi:hypothetical protein
MASTCQLCNSTNLQTNLQNDAKSKSSLAISFCTNCSLVQQQEIPSDEELNHIFNSGSGTENESGTRLKTAFVKKLTGGDTLSGSEMYQKTQTFSPTHKLALVVNHKPEVDAADIAFWKRAVLIPFTVIN